MEFWIFQINQSNFVNPEANVVLLIIAMITAKNKLKILNFFSYACLMVFVVMCLKSVFMDGRPYMVNGNIIPMEKYAEYGNPSGHVFMGYIVMTYVLENYLYCHDLWIEEYERKPSLSNVEIKKGKAEKESKKQHGQNA